jgi:hypothetical protein
MSRRADRKQRTPDNLTEYKKVWGIKLPPRKAYPKEIPDTVKHFYRRKPFRPRLDITLEEIKDILHISTPEASEVIEKIKQQSYKTDFPFITIKEFARYAKLQVWQVHQYFISDQVYEDIRTREDYKGRHH